MSSSFRSSYKKNLIKDILNKMVWYLKFYNIFSVEHDRIRVKSVLSMHFG